MFHFSLNLKIVLHTSVQNLLVCFCSSYVETFSTEQLTSTYTVDLFFFPEAFNFVFLHSATQAEKMVAEPMTYYENASVSITAQKWFLRLWLENF